MSFFEKIKLLASLMNSSSSGKEANELSLIILMTFSIFFASNIYFSFHFKMANPTLYKILNFSKKKISMILNTKLKGKKAVYRVKNQPVA